MSTREWKETTKLIEASVAILAEQSPMTIRQLFYRLVTLVFLKNNRAAYERVSSVMTKARGDGRVAWNLIVDRSRPDYSPYVFEDAAKYCDSVLKMYRKNYWHIQPNHVEVWVEKDAIMGSIENLTDELGITVRPTRGFSSTTKVHEIATLFSTINKPITVFYLGDHDPSGCDMDRDVEARVLQHGSGPFTFRRLGILKSDIAKFHLPPLRVKESDSRKAGFREKYGEDCVELDALPPLELRKRIKDAVEALMDRELWDRAVAVEKVEQDSIKTFAATLKGLQTATSGDLAGA